MGLVNLTRPDIANAIAQAFQNKDEPKEPDHIRVPLNGGPPIPQEDPALRIYGSEGTLSPLGAWHTMMADSMAHALRVKDTPSLPLTQDSIAKLGVSPLTIGAVLPDFHVNNPDDTPRLYLSPRQIPAIEAQQAVAHELAHLAQFDPARGPIYETFKHTPKALNEEDAEFTADAIQFIRGAGTHGDSDRLRRALDSYVLTYGNRSSTPGDPRVRKRIEENVRKYGGRQPYKGNSLIQMALEGL